MTIHEPASSIMFQGTGSDVGKSILIAGMCRLLARKVYKVAPFKAQNMALNSGVASDGEMGRAQILQAEAAGIEPDTRMNPILLKPIGNATSQVIRLGKPIGNYSARDYYTLSKENFEYVKKAFDSLADEYDIILIEGAGSPAEINLHKTDIVNMRTAYYTDSPVYIIGDIDRGGVFAWLKGTYDLVPDEYRHLIRGFIINKFRGDISLLQPGIEMFSKIVEPPVIGTVPMLSLNLEEEDSQNVRNSDKNAEVTVGVVRLKRMSNFSDFTALSASPDINLIYAEKPEQLENADIIVIPGSKSTIADLQDIRDRGFEKVIRENVGKKPVIGICGGFQMLGKVLKDPARIEGDADAAIGLSILDAHTVITESKTLLNCWYEGANLFKEVSFKGYEIHMGETEFKKEYTQLSTSKDICIFDEKNKVIGTYIHGIFDNDEITRKIISLTGKNISPDFSFYKNKMAQLDMLADTLEQNLDIEYILSDLC
jgi:adenosylcobyric acid synthase